MKTPEALEDLGKIIAEQQQKISFGMADAWERVLRLHIRPKPKWCPDRLWVKLVSLVVVQSDQWK